MTCKQAEQIANLINARNGLLPHVTTEDVFKNQTEYLFRSIEITGEIYACVRIKKLSWYLAAHLAVAKTHQNQGNAADLLEQCIAVAKDQGARLLSCTVKAENSISKRLFLSKGFMYVNSFVNEITGNRLNVYHKDLNG